MASASAQIPNRSENSTLAAKHVMKCYQLRRTTSVYLERYSSGRKYCNMASKRTIRHPQPHPLCSLQMRHVGCKLTIVLCTKTQVANSGVYFAITDRHTILLTHYERHQRPILSGIDESSCQATPYFKHIIYPFVRMSFFPTRG